MSMSVILAILFIGILWLVTRSKSTDKLAKFWKQSKYPTKWDIQQKYPKSQSLQQKSIERKRREAIAKNEAEASRKQQIIDRHISELKQTKLADIELINPQKHEGDLDTQPKISTNIPNSSLDNDSQISSNNSEYLPIKAFEILVKMTSGREEVAIRLVKENLKKYPEMSPTWACKKAILDLERYLEIKKLSLREKK